MKHLVLTLVLLSVSCANRIGTKENKTENPSENSDLKVEISQFQYKENPLEFRWVSPEAGGMDFEIRGCTRTTNECRLIATLICSQGPCIGFDVILDPIIQLDEDEVELVNDQYTLSLATVLTLAQTGTDWVEIRVKRADVASSWQAGEEVLSFPSN